MHARAARTSLASVLLATPLFALVSVLGACSADPPLPSGSCSSARDCRAGEACVAGRCRASGDGGMDGAPADAPPGGPDVPGLDAVPTMAVGCSADLRSTLDAAGNVLATCPPDQGCNMGRCVPACDAAAASRGSVGCAFMVATPPAYPPALPPCLAVCVANTWPRPARLTVARGAMSFDATAFGRLVDNARPVAEWMPLPATGIPENQVAVLFLSSDPNSVMPENGVHLSCPIRPAIDASTMLEGSGTTDAFRIGSDTPVTAYDILPYGGARSHFPSAELLLPTSAWGTGYVALSPPLGTYDPPGPQWLQVVALEDNTTVRVRPTVDLPGAGAAPAVARGAEGSVRLAAGQYVQWQLPAGNFDAVGSLLAADHAVGVVTGTRFLRLQTMPAPGGEAAHQQILPIDALSNVYVAAPYETRRADLMPEPVPYRLVGAADGTRLTFDPPIAGAPAALNRGDVALLTTAQPFVVSSQDEAHPFAMAQLMTSGNVPGGSRPGAVAPGFGPVLGDEEFVVVFPPAQYLTRYVFFTDPAYATTNLVVVRVRGADGAFHPVQVGCLGELTGFRPIGSSGRYEYTTADLVRAAVGVGACTNGRQTAQSDGPFGVIVWGLDSYSSYAYPAGGNAARLSMIMPPL